MKNKKVIIISIAFVISIGVFAQKRTGIGLRIDSDNGTEFGATLKYRLIGTTTLEAIATFPTNAVILNGLYEKYHSLSRSGSFQFFYGGGVFIGVGGGNKAAGLKGILGLCYNFKDIPVDLSVDWFPGMQIIDKIDARLNNFGISLRYKF